MVRWVKNLTAVAQVAVGSIPSPAQWVKRSGVAATVAQTQSLAMELPYALGVAIKKKKKVLKKSF